MLRRSFLAIAPLAAAFALSACNDTSELPRVPPPPPEGTVKASSGGAATLPPEAAAKLRGRNKQLNTNVEAN